MKCPKLLVKISFWASRHSKTNVIFRLACTNVPVRIYFRRRGGGPWALYFRRFMMGVFAKIHFFGHYTPYISQIIYIIFLTLNADSIFFSNELNFRKFED